MQFFPDPTTFVQIGVFSIKYYALTMLTGALVAYYFILKDMKKNGYKTEVVDDLFVGCFLIGIIGARIWYILFLTYLII